MCCIHSLKSFGGFSGYTVDWTWGVIKFFFEVMYVVSDDTPFPCYDSKNECKNVEWNE